MPKNAHAKIEFLFVNFIFLAPPKYYLIVPMHKLFSRVLAIVAETMSVDHLVSDTEQFVRRPVLLSFTAYMDALRLDPKNNGASRAASELLFDRRNSDISRFYTFSHPSSRRAVKPEDAIRSYRNALQAIVDELREHDGSNHEAVDAYLERLLNLVVFELQERRIFGRESADVVEGIFEKIDSQLGYRNIQEAESVVSDEEDSLSASPGGWV